MIITVSRYKAKLNDVEVEFSVNEKGKITIYRRDGHQTEFIFQKSNLDMVDSIGNLFIGISKFVREQGLGATAVCIDPPSENDVIRQI
jgi:hypothetical protein